MGVHGMIIGTWKLRQMLFPVHRVLLVLDLCVNDQLNYMLLKRIKVISYV